jgi:hypothetical protein
MERDTEPKKVGPTRGGILLAVGVCVLVLVVFVERHHTQQSLAHVSQSTLDLPLAISSSTSATATSSAETTSTSTTSILGHDIKKVTLGADVQSAISAPITPPSVVQARELAAAGGSLLRSTVNIVCVSGNPSIPSISGSGVIIDSRGIILTAAHVAQVLALEDYLGPRQVSCIIRGGSPARREYLAEPIYISPLWVAANPKTLTTTSPRGTGENDFALLGITATATSTPLPSSYSAIPLFSGQSAAGEPVAIGSYGAEYLSSTDLNYSLYPILVFGSIQQRFTFTNDSEDLLSIVGSAASQEGSSGGGIINTDGRLIGEITTSSIAGDLSTRSLNAVTIGHIRRSYANDTGNSLDAVLAGSSVQDLIAHFAPESKVLGQTLYSNL